eukprot:4941736-Pyramimonas_sp.AAC.1
MTGPPTHPEGKTNFRHVAMTARLEQVEASLFLGLCEAVRQNQRRCAPTPVATLWPGLPRNL